MGFTLGRVIFAHAVWDFNRPYIPLSPIFLVILTFIFKKIESWDVPQILQMNSIKKNELYENIAKKLTKYTMKNLSIDNKVRLGSI